MFSNLQIRPAKPPRRKPNLIIHSGVSKRRVSVVSALSASRVPSLSFMEGLFGDEFPEAFASGDGPPAKSRKTILDLPAELLEIVCTHISKLDIKHLRLACKQLADSVYLRIDRVYVSPNRANLDYLYQILSHPSYKYRVREIVWDDARLGEYSTLTSFRKAILWDERFAKIAIENRLEEAIWIYGVEDPYYHAPQHDDLFDIDMRLTDVAKKILLRYGDQFSRDVLARNAIMMGIEESYSLYQDLYHDEQAIMKQQSHIQALQQALMGFPALKRVTFTTEAWVSYSHHGSACPSRYNTPFHKSLPVGFCKPSVAPVSPAYITESQAQDSPLQTLISGDQSPIGLQGYPALVSAIADMQVPKIEEFVVEPGEDDPYYPAPLLNSFGDYITSKNVEYTVRMFQRTRLKYLKFFINSRMDARPESIPHDSTINRNLFAKLEHLEHLDLSLNYNKEAPVFGKEPRLIPIPNNLRQQLKTLTLHHILAECDDIVGLLTSMPKLQHVTLCRLYQWNTGPSWMTHLERLKAYYNSPECPNKPNFAIRQVFVFDTSCFQVADREVDDYLFGSGENPFSGDELDQFAQLKPHIGWKVNVRDETLRERMRDFSARNKMHKRDDDTE